MRSTLTRTLSCLLALIVFSSCSPAPRRGPTAIEGSSDTLRVSGTYQFLDIDQVDSFAIQNGKLAIKGPSGTVLVDLPPGAGGPKPGQQWVLTTENQTRRQAQTFTHEQSLDDFTLSLPLDDADLRYGTLAGENGEDLLILAWGKNGRSYWGHVKIGHKDSAPHQ
jgi:hypothetical protein